MIAPVRYISIIALMVFNSFSLNVKATEKIAFSTIRDAAAAGSEIYIMNVDGSNPVRLTNSVGDDQSPSWSPDAMKIVFASSRAGEFRDIYSMDADGFNVVQLTNIGTSESTEPSWSPDGTKIAFKTFRDGNQEIYVMNADGSSPVNITNHNAVDSGPAWSPDGTQIAFASSRGNDIYVMDADGSNLKRLTITDSNVSEATPSWSPDGKKIAFSSERDGNREIYIMDAIDGRNQINLTNDPRNDTAPSWTPDGRIIFSSNRVTSSKSFIYLMNADGSSVAALTNGEGSDISPTWSPAPRPAISPITMDFGSVTVGENQTTSVSVKNTGTGVLQITSTPIIGFDPDQFDVNTPFFVAPNDSHSVNVSFSPTHVGWSRADLVLVGTQSGADTVSLSGIGRINPTAGDLSQTKIAF